MRRLRVGVGGVAVLDEAVTGLAPAGSFPPSLGFGESANAPGVDGDRGAPGVSGGVPGRAGLPKRFR